MLSQPQRPTSGVDSSKQEVPSMENIPDIRKNRGYSQLHVAQKCQIDPRNLSAYETGKRRWPWDELQRVREFLKLPAQEAPLTLIKPGDHRLIVPPDFRVHVDPGPTWATIDLKYEGLYRQLKPKRTPDLVFRSKVRTDSGHEPASWIQLFEAGAEGKAACPGLLNFPYHPLVDCSGNPLGTQYRAAFAGKFDDYNWLLFPQITLMLPDRLYRPDAIVLRYGPDIRWSLTQLDGGAHQNEEWDRKLDRAVRIPTLRFPAAHTLSLQFAEVFRDAILSL